MRRGPRELAAVSRRRILRALALAPAALAGCAAASAGRPAGGAAAHGAAAPATPAGEPRAPGVDAAAIRRFALPADAEPAFVFRAAAARPGEPR